MKTISLDKLTRELEETLLRKNVLTKDTSSKARRCYILCACGDAYAATGELDENMAVYTDEEVAAADIVLRALLYVQSLDVPGGIDELLTQRADYLCAHGRLVMYTPPDAEE